MKTIADAVSQIAIEVHPDRVEAICTSLSGLRKGDIRTAIRECLGKGFSDHLIDQLGIALAKHPQVSPAEVCAMFRAAAATAALADRRSALELVWSGPATGLVPIRHTEQVLISLIDQAQQRLFVVSFVAFHVENIIQALYRSVKRGVEVRILVERAREDGGNLNVDSMGILRTSIPGASFYEWQKDPTDEGAYSAVHAKCAVADNEHAFITSANLSEAAMERNMELGVLIRGGPLPGLLERHLSALITTRQIRQL